jgi:hypothetical protein
LQLFRTQSRAHGRGDGADQGDQRPEALQCLEGEESKDNEITIIVSSYDFDADKDVTLFVKGTAPGKYALAKARAALPQQGGTNVPKDD